jgi:hypothetical protein
VLGEFLGEEKEVTGKELRPRERKREGEERVKEGKEDWE